MMSTRDMQDYLSHHQVPQLLESVLTGLLHHRPEDPLSFLHTCLTTTTRLGGPGALTWDSFIRRDRPQDQDGAQDQDPVQHQAGPQDGGGPLHQDAPQPQEAPQQNRAQDQEGPHWDVALHREGPSPGSQRSPTAGSRRTVGPQALLDLTPHVPVLRGPRALFSPNPPGTEGPQDTRAPSTEGSPPGPCPFPLQTRLSIDSDSDLTESSGLLQEVRLLHPQRPRPPIIFIIGGPGSGKGSQAACLAQRFDLGVVSLDEVLRRQLLGHAPPDRKWEVMSELMSRGELGAQEEMMSELRRQLIGRQEVGGVIVDGFPRDVHQALSFQEQVGPPDLVMLLLCSNQTLRCRLQRRTARLGLLGDGGHALRRRLETFERDIVSIRRYYRQLHLLTQVEADGSLQQVFAHLSSVVREKLDLKDSSDPADVPECSGAASSVDQHHEPEILL